MISVWGKFYPAFNQLRPNESCRLSLPAEPRRKASWIGSTIPYSFYDAFNAGARKLYWDQINTALFSKGIDAWWEDATEPDLTASPPTLENPAPTSRRPPWAPPRAS